MSNPLTVLAVTMGLIAVSALFVAVEFALLTARKHRLEDAAAKSYAARAALRSTTELSVLLAGSQLGITACTLALGATTKPAVHHWLTPLIRALGAPPWVADAGSFVLALAIVTFLHLVIGEMAPKSWAIAHPERAAIILAIPMRMFMTLTRPVLIALNRAANWCVRMVGVNPVDELAEGQDPETLRQLVEHSAAAGTLDERNYRNLARALDLRKLTVGDIVSPTTRLSTVAADADPAAIQAMSQLTGHQRLLVADEKHAPIGVVHVRDSLRPPPGTTARDLMRPLLRLQASTPVYRALAQMRKSRNHVAIVVDSGSVGLVTMTDLLQRLLAEADAAA